MQFLFTYIILSTIKHARISLVIQTYKVSIFKTSMTVLSLHKNDMLRNDLTLNYLQVQFNPNYLNMFYLLYNGVTIRHF